MEMRCYRKILRISYKDHVTNEEVRAKFQQAIGPHQDLLTMLKRRKLQWYGHVSRSSGLAKTILQSTVKRGRRQGRQRKRWEDNIREWTGLEFGKSQRAVESREKWRKLVAKSSVVPQRPSRLRIDNNDDFFSLKLVFIQAMLCYKSCFVIIALKHRRYTFVFVCTYTVSRRIQGKQVKFTLVQTNVTEYIQVTKLLYGIHFLINFS